MTVDLLRFDNSIVILFSSFHSILINGHNRHVNLFLEPPSVPVAMLNVSFSPVAWVGLIIFPETWQECLPLNDIKCTNSSLWNRAEGAKETQSFVKHGTFSCCWVFIIASLLITLRINPLINVYKAFHWFLLDYFFSNFRSPNVCCFWDRLRFEGYTLIIIKC